MRDGTVIYENPDYPQSGSMHASIQQTRSPEDHVKIRTLERRREDWKPITSHYAIIDSVTTFRKPFRHLEKADWVLGKPYIEPICEIFWTDITTPLKLAPNLESRAHNQAGLRHETESERLIREIRALSQLSHNWDGEGSQPPSRFAASSAKLVCSDLPNDLMISEIEADVLGGIILWVTQRNQLANNIDKLAWFAVRNSGRVLLTCDEHQNDGFLSVDDVTDIEVAAKAIRQFFAR